MERPDAMVAIVQTNGKTGFFPFCRRAGDIADPIGGALNDFQGPIGSAETNIADWLHIAGLRAYRFSHLPVVKASLSDCGSIVCESPYLDLSAGIESYERNHLGRSRREIPVAAQKFRKVARELGAIEFEFSAASRFALETAIQWKLAQCRRTGCYSALAETWARNLLFRLAEYRSEGFSGVLSTLSMGGQLAAVLFSLRSYETLHGCVTAFNPALARYSPGLQLFLQTIRAAAADGVTRFDLGRGSERYKRCLANQSEAVTEGCADLRPVSATLWRASLHLRHYLRGTPLRPLVARLRMLSAAGR